MENISLFKDTQTLNSAILSGEIFQHPQLLEELNAVRLNNKHVHLMGLISRSKALVDLDHWSTALKLLSEQQISPVYLHAILGGVDAPAVSAEPILDTLNDQLLKFQVGQWASLVGRWYLQTEENSSNRLQQLYQALVEGKAGRAADYHELLRRQYQQGVTDEFIPPTLLSGSDGQVRQLQAGDVLWLMNHNPEVMKKLSTSFSQVPLLKLVTMTA